MSKATEGSDRRALIALIGALLKSFQRRKREPDRWESFHTLGALNHLAMGNLREGELQSRLARMPGELRPPAQYRRIPKDFEPMSGAELREALNEIAAGGPGATNPH
jgi:hypothetical protein